jgi:hypothetical protein
MHLARKERFGLGAVARRIVGFTAFGVARAIGLDVHRLDLSLIHRGTGPRIGGAALALDPTFTVNSTADVADATVGGICDTGRSVPPAPASPECTLCAALQEAQAPAAPPRSYCPLART